MKQRIFIVHGWSAAPDREWFPWLADQLEPYGLAVHIPAMPDTMRPTIDEWVGALHTEIGELRSTDILVGHSIGCQTILRYLELYGDGVSVPVIFVAGWFSLQGLENAEEEDIARPWLDTAINLAFVRERCRPLYGILSDNDPYVELDENKRLFEDRLGGFVTVMHDMGHFSEAAGIYELPIVRDSILKFIL